jgi:hypothetical protein
VALTQNETYFMTLVAMATAMALHFYHYHRLHGRMPLKSSTVPESSILSCLHIYSPGKVLNSDKNEFLDIAVTTFRHVSVLTIINEL